MHIRFHKGQYVDAVVPGSVGVLPAAAPGDVVWQLTADINPSKTVEETENVQEVDPETGQPLFNEDGTPVWQTELIENPDGSTSEVIVTQLVSRTVYLLSGPQYFTPADIEAAASYTVIGSLDEAKANKLSELASARDNFITSDFTSGTRTYGYNEVDQKNYRGLALDVLLDPTVTTVTFKTKLDGVMGHTKEEFVQVCKDAKIHEESAWVKWFSLEAEVNAATTLEEVEAIAW